MRREYDFHGAKRGPILPIEKGKTRITIRLDNEVLSWFRSQVHGAGGGNYQKLINQALRSYVADQQQHEPLESVIRRLHPIVNGCDLLVSIVTPGARCRLRSNGFC